MADAAGSGAAAGAVVVVGSVNRDTSYAVDHLPVPGETVLSESVEQHLGGKGANQAVAAARLGRPVALVARVGADDAGVAALGELAAERVDTAAVTTAPLPTGAATVVVARGGENQIVVAAGANGALDAADVDDAAPLLRGAAVALVQLEIPLGAVARAVELAAGTVVLNPAPAAPLPRELLAGVDVLVPNRVELAALAGAQPAATRAQVAAQVAALGLDADVVVTLGGDGALVVRRGAIEHVAPVAVEPLDTTGAGDAFAGALADALARGAELLEAVRWAAACAARSTLRRGASPSFPGATEVAPHPDAGAPAPHPDGGAAALGRDGVAAPQQRGGR
ncbi:ribokinase [Conexibacter sp. CPCC 206217]|uniref:ribokinase n=1 Tax=Conexibacter sp. CPCC 206217 TaxID=3064574 RepID=UPI002720FE89|nr:ribokinase [Conexibacter sp. CPCC 206217]MDO8208838.1 ribokinase [Conexibacter sp. CPCC 206217]